jgi:hypothetical protein
MASAAGAERAPEIAHVFPGFPTDGPRIITRENFDPKKTEVLAWAPAEARRAEVPHVEPQVVVYTEAPVKDQAAKKVLTEPAFLLGHSWHNKSWQSQIDACVARLKELPAGKRGIAMGGWFVSPLFTFNAFHGYTPQWFPRPDWPGVKPLPAIDPVADFERGHVLPDWEIARLKPLGDAIKGAGLKVDYIYLDVENIYGYWTLPADVRRRILKSPAARAFFPAHLREMTEGGVEPSDLSRPATRDYVQRLNAHGQSLCVRAIEQVLKGSGVATTTTTVINFNTTKPGGFPIYDPNAWISVGDSVPDHLTSSPCLYLATGVHRFPPPKLSKDPLWNAFIEDINKVRSLVHLGPVIPTMQTCQRTPARDWLVEKTIGHVLRTGVTTIDLFNPAECKNGGEEAFANWIVMHRDHASATRQLLKEVPLDADEVRTGDFVTVYEDFVKAAKSQQK